MKWSRLQNDQTHSIFYVAVADSSIRLHTKTSWKLVRFREFLNVHNGLAYIEEWVNLL
jgi:hypothetical protein